MEFTISVKSVYHAAYYTIYASNTLYFLYTDGVCAFQKHHRLVVAAACGGEGGAAVAQQEARISR